MKNPIFKQIEGGIQMDKKETIEYCISSAIKIGLESYNKTLDFSDESIQNVNEILNGYHERYLHPEEDDGLIQEKVNIFALIFGIYVGEVLLRKYHSAYAWKDTEYGFVLAKDETNFINPVGKARKQIVNGKENGDDIKSFFDVANAIMQEKF